MVAGLISMLLITVSSLFMATVTSNLRTSSKLQIKEEGGYVMGQIEFMLRNSAKLIENSGGQVCETGMEMIKFVNPNGHTTEFSLVNSQISSNSAVLHSTSVTASVLNFDCARNPGGEYYVDTSFTMIRSDTTISENFGHLVLLRN